MAYQALSDLVLIVHLAFVIFVALGGFLVLKRRWLAWVHVPACLWGALVEFAGWVCPLTPLENWLRQQGGGLVYRTDFIAYYILPVLYPVILTRGLQIFLGLLVLSVNLVLYGWLLWHAPKQAGRNSSSHG
jgi:hypothetical protein